jgi:hypothetical protein
LIGLRLWSTSNINDEARVKSTTRRKLSLALPACAFLCLALLETVDTIGFELVLASDKSSPASEAASVKPVSLHDEKCEKADRGRNI